MQIIIRRIFNTHIDRLWRYHDTWIKYNSIYTKDIKRFTNEEFKKEYGDALYNEAITKKEFYEEILW